MKTILVAEDREASREFLCTVLESCGYAVVEAADGKEVVLRAREVAVDLVILDLYMPNANGFEVLEQLRTIESYANTPVIALTASAMAGDKERAMLAGFSDFLSKPINLADLRREVGRWLEVAGQA